MPSKILITGAAGYIGGSVLSHLTTIDSASINSENIIAAVRSKEQATTLIEAGFNALQVSLNDGESVTKFILQNEINVVVHCASGLEQDLVVNLINALGKRREAMGRPTYFIHTSGGSAFAEYGGWTNGLTSDTDRVFDLEKAVADSNPLRKVDVTVTEQAKSQGVTSYIIVPPLVYGRGGGQWNKLSVCIPRYVRASLSHKAVYTFSKDMDMPAVHLSDLMALYARLLEKIVHNEAPPSGENGYYFAVAHEMHWWPTLNLVAAALYSRGLVKEPKTEIWPSDEVAAESLGLPIPFMHMIWNSKTMIQSRKNSVIGWQPAWTHEDEFLQTIDDEVQDVLELDKVKSSVFNNLNQ